ncbi:MAG TPA: hypothetical protein VE912_08175 [Bacteroidales bacterium]|nr:hypothetical protein [Bacteroidales bacterium]
MTKADQLNILAENTNALSQAIKWLERSFSQCRHLDTSALSDDETDRFETLTSRFARVTDLLFSKVFRSIAYLEKGEALSWLDMLIFMEKQEVIDDADKARLIKELRNDITHEYIMTNLPDLFKEVVAQSPLLLRYCSNALAKTEKLKKKLKNL